MLTHLSIKNLAVVAEMSLEIPDQMTVITGETGVGKSLMVDGLALLLGQRADASMIGQAGDSAEISGVFAIQGLQAVLAWLETKSLAAPDPELIIREGDLVPEILAQIAEDGEIGVLVLGAGSDRKGPGPLVSQLSRASATLPIPITIVPGELSKEKLQAIT